MCPFPGAAGAKYKGRHVILLVFCFVFSSHLVQWCYLIEKGRMGSNIEGTEMAILM